MSVILPRPHSTDRYESDTRIPLLRFQNPVFLFQIQVRPVMLAVTAYLTTDDFPYAVIHISAVHHRHHIVAESEFLDEIQVLLHLGTGLHHDHVRH